MEVLDKGNGLFFSLNGSERVSDSELRDVTIVQGLVLPPPVEVRGSGAGFTRDCLSATETFTWKIGHWKDGPFNLPDQSLNIHFDGRTHAITVGSQIFDIRNGGFLIIRLDNGWRPVLTQFDVPGANGLAELRRALPNVADLQAARLYSEAKH